VSRDFRNVECQMLPTGQCTFPPLTRPGLGSSGCVVGNPDRTVILHTIQVLDPPDEQGNVRLGGQPTGTPELSSQSLDSRFDLAQLASTTKSELAFGLLVAGRIIFAHCLLM
jgi:hypothetical protein